jgi:hypothetical protein
MHEDFLCVFVGVMLLFLNAKRTAANGPNADLRGEGRKPVMTATSHTLPALPDFRKIIFSSLK